ncbi:MAG TPA: pyridoxal-phosphate dependent enzyme [Thermoplasmataceae archaeon]|nr:pyridoxal-phosphate dependent enzyme [Thermoplasmataceae archaeon]
MSGNSYEGLVCLECGKAYDSTTLSVCESCGGILTGRYNLDDVEIDLKNRGRSIWHFKDLFPPVSPENITSLNEGWTPYVEAKSYGKEIGASNLWCKLEGQNPSGSFKDRVGSMEVSLVKEWHKEGIFTASSGNAAAAISTYAARGGIKSLLLVREDSTISKLGQISMYDPTIIRVRNLFSTKDSLFKALQKVQEALPTWHNGFVWAPFNPLALDALKTVAYEIAATHTPDYIIVPTAGGDLLYAIFKGFSELKELGLVDSIPKMVPVQGAGANPLVQAIDRKLDSVEDTETADTIAGALRVNFGANHPLMAVKGSGGFGITVTDAEIMDAQKEIAKREGIFSEMSSATALAAVKRAISDGRIRGDETVSAMITGNGFKDYVPRFTSAEQVTLMNSVDELSEKIKGLV